MPSEAKDCTDVKCKDVKHCEAVDTFMANILHSVQNAAFEDLPVVNNNELKRKNVVPGWSAEVKPFRDTAYFWSQIWKSAGRPLNNELHRIMKRTRNIYHFQARKCKQGEEYIKRSKLLDACVNGSEDIFSEIKKLRGCVPITASALDSIKDDIPGHFQTNYSELYNSVDDKVELSNLAKSVDEAVNQNHINDVNKVTPEVVQEAAKQLKDNKSDPVYSFSSDSIKNGPEVLFD